MTASEKRLRTLKGILFIAAAVEVLVGLLHFVMPLEYRDSAGLGALDGAEADYVTLVTYAVGILLVAFGATTYLLARRPAHHLDVLVPYLLVKTILWAARSALEVAYPVQLEMFGVDPFTTLVLPGVLAQTAVFAVAGVLAYRIRTVRPQRSCTETTSPPDSHPL